MQSPTLRPPLNADDALTIALAEAKASDRLVFLHFGAPWCTWCLKLETWMGQPAIAAIFAHDYVDIRVDVDNTPRGQGLADNLGAPGGIPWYAIIQPDGTAHGKILVTSSTIARYNIGYPGTPDRIDIFMAMLKQTARHTSPRDLEAIRTSLQAAANPTPD